MRGIGGDPSTLPLPSLLPAGSERHGGTTPVMKELIELIVVGALIFYAWRSLIKHGK
jgi:hypothetical protein